MGVRGLCKAASQIIPVLLLALIVDKGSEYTRSGAFDRLALVGVSASLIVAGWVTLSALATDTAVGQPARPVVASLLCAVAALAVSLAAGTAKRSRRARGGVQGGVQPGRADKAGSDHQIRCACARPTYRHELGTE